MDIIPIEPSDEMREMLNVMQQFPLTLVKINNPGDYENENIVFEANEDIESLYDFILVYEVEDSATGLPVYEKCRFLTFDDIEVKKGNFVQVHTCKGDDTTEKDFDTSTLYHVIYWGLSKAIWKIPHVSFMLMERGNAYRGLNKFN